MSLTDLVAEQFSAFLGSEAIKGVIKDIISNIFSSSPPKEIIDILGGEEKLFYLALEFIKKLNKEQKETLKKAFLGRKDYKILKEYIDAWMRDQLGRDVPCELD